MNGLTNFVLRHRRWIMLAWLIVALVGVATLGSTTKRLSTQFKMPGEPSFVTDSKINALYHTNGAPTVVAVTAPAGQSASPAVANRVFMAAAAAVPGSRLADQANTGDAHFSASAGQMSFGLIFTPLDNGFRDTQTPAFTAAAAAAAPARWHTGVTGIGQLESGGSSNGNSALTETLLGGIGALLVLAFVFASFIAVLPMLMAIVAIPTTFLLVNGLTHITSVSIIVEFLIALIGLGVSIDYALLVVTRWREERAHGHPNHEAVARAMNSAGRAVVFSGLTVAISLLAIVVIPVSFLANIGVAGFLIPLVSVGVALTLLPALLASVGPGCLTGWDRLVLRYRKSAALIGGAILIALVIPVFAINLGEPKSSVLAQTGVAHDTLVSLEAGGVPSGVIEPMEVLVQADDAPAVAARLAQVKGVDTAVAPSGPLFHRGGTAIVEVLPSAEPSTSAGGATISAVRSTAAHLPGVIGVGGTGPEQVDFVHAVYGSHRDRHAAAADPCVPFDRAGGQGGGVQPAVGRRRLRDHGARLAGGPR